MDKNKEIENIAFALEKFKTGYDFKKLNEISNLLSVERFSENGFKAVLSNAIDALYPIGENENSVLKVWFLLNPDYNDRNLQNRIRKFEKESNLNYRKCGYIVKNNKNNKYHEIANYLYDSNKDPDKAAQLSRIKEILQPKEMLNSGESYNCRRCEENAKKLISDYPIVHIIGDMGSGRHTLLRHLYKSDGTILKAYSDIRITDESSAKEMFATLCYNLAEVSYHANNQSNYYNLISSYINSIKSFSENSDKNEIGIIRSKIFNLSCEEFLKKLIIEPMTKTHEKLTLYIFGNEYICNIFDLFYEDFIKYNIHVMIAHGGDGTPKAKIINLNLPENKEDVKQYIISRGAKNDELNLIVDKSGLNYLLASLILKEINVNNNCFNEYIPSTISSYYRLKFYKLFNLPERVSVDEIKLFISILTLFGETVEKNLIKEITGITLNKINYITEESNGLIVSKNDKIFFFHKSLYDWENVDKSDYSANIELAQKATVKYYLSEYYKQKDENKNKTRISFYSVDKYKNLKAIYKILSEYSSYLDFDDKYSFKQDIEFMFHLQIAAAYCSDNNLCFELNKKIQQISEDNSQIDIFTLSDLMDFELHWEINDVNLDNIWNSFINKHSDNIGEEKNIDIYSQVLLDEIMMFYTQKKYIDALPKIKFLKNFLLNSRFPRGLESIRSEKLVKINYWHGIIHYNLEQYDLCVNELKEGIRRAKKDLSEDYYLISICELTQGYAYLNTGRTDKAIQKFENCLEYRTKKFGPQSRYTIAAKDASIRAICYKYSNRIPFEIQEKYVERMNDILDYSCLINGLESKMTCRYYETASELFIRLGRLTNAIDYINNAIAIRKKYPNDFKEMATAYEFAGDVYRANFNKANSKTYINLNIAKDYYENCLKIRKEKMPNSKFIEQVEKKLTGINNLLR